MTASEKSAIEAQDAKWEPWSDELIAQWDAACGTYGGYNRTTGFGELNGLTDITASQARVILSKSNGGTALYKSMFARSDIRTNLCPGVVSQGIPQTGFGYAFYRCALLEVAVVAADGLIVVMNDADNTFGGCANLRKVKGQMMLNSSSSSNIFGGCSMLEDIDVLLRHNLDLKSSPKITYATLQRIVNNRESGRAAITVTLHADAYARLTDELIASAAAKQITFATPT